MAEIQHLRRAADGHLMKNPTDGHLVKDQCTSPQYIKAEACDGSVHDIWFALNEDGTIETTLGSRSLPFYFRTALGTLCMKVEEGNDVSDTLGTGTLASGYTESESCEDCESEPPDDEPCPDGGLAAYWAEVAEANGSGGWVPTDAGNCNIANPICAASNPTTAWTFCGYNGDGLQVFYRYLRGVATDGSCVPNACCATGSGPPQTCPDYTPSVPPFPSDTL